MGDREERLQKLVIVAVVFGLALTCAASVVSIVLAVRGS